MTENPRHFSAFKISLILFIACFSLYLGTAAFDLHPGPNHGELAASGATLGISHPTGYPVFTVLSHGVSLLPAGSRICRIHLLSALLCALSTLLLYLCLSPICANPWIPMVIALSYALETLVWQQATVAEIYGFHLVFMGLIIIALQRYNSTGSSRWAFLGFFLLGLSFGNHLITIFLLPLFLVFALKHRWRTCLTGSIFLGLGLSSYLYLPIRASQHCTILWKNPARFSSFIDHITGAQFQRLMLHAEPGILLTRITHLLGSFWQDYHSVLCTFALIGIGTIIIRPRKFYLYLALSGLFSFLFALTYRIHDIEAYYLPTLWIVVFLAGMGLDHLTRSFRITGFVCSLGFLGLILFTGFPRGYSTSYRCTNHAARQFGTAILRSTPYGTPLIYQGDNPLNTLTYLQAVEKQRTDIRLIDATGNLAPMGTPPLRSGKRQHGATFRHIAHRALAHPHGVIYLQADGAADTIDPRLFSMPAAFEPSIFSKDASTREMAAQYLINLGDTCCETNGWEVGISHYERASCLTYDIPGVAGYLGSLFASRGLLQEAIDIETSLLMDYPDDDTLRNNLSYHRFLAVDQLETAAKEAAMAAHNHPDNTVFAETLIRIQLLVGNLDKAQAIIANIPDISPTIHQQMERYRAMQKAHPVFPLDITRNDHRFDHQQIEILLEKGAWEHIRAGLCRLAREIMLSDSQVDMLIRSAHRTDTVSGAIFVLEQQIRRYDCSRHLVNALVSLHRSIGNSARVRMLLGLSTTE
jgi:tetratricopeptide (TPR) repeat protein